MKTQSKQSLVKAAYLTFRKDNQESLGEFKWSDKEELALKLASEYDEDILRIAASMSGTYARSQWKMSKNLVDFVIPTEDNNDIA